MKQKVAVFQRIGEFEYLTVWNSRPGKTDEQSDDAIPDGYVRRSPWLEIDFPELDNSEIVAKQLQQLDAAEQSARNELQQKLKSINDVRQRLMALPPPKDTID